jgi:hypothetical protein
MINLKDTKGFIDRYVSSQGGPIPALLYPHDVFEDYKVSTPQRVFNLPFHLDITGYAVAWHTLE